MNFSFFHPWYLLFRRPCICSQALPWPVTSHSFSFVRFWTMTLLLHLVLNSYKLPLLFAIRSWYTSACFLPFQPFCPFRVLNKHILPSSLHRNMTHSPSNQNPSLYRVYRSAFLFLYNFNFETLTPVFLVNGCVNDMKRFTLPR